MIGRGRRRRKQEEEPALPTTGSRIRVGSRSSGGVSTWLSPAIGTRGQVVLEPGESELAVLGVGEVAGWFVDGEETTAMWSLGMGGPMFSTAYRWTSSELVVTDHRVVWKRLLAQDRSDWEWELGHARFEWLAAVEVVEHKVAFTLDLEDVGDTRRELMVTVDLEAPEQALALANWVARLALAYRAARLAVEGIEVGTPAQPPSGGLRIEDGVGPVELADAAWLGGSLGRTPTGTLGRRAEGAPPQYLTEPLTGDGTEASPTPGELAGLVDRGGWETDRRVVRGPVFQPLTVCGAGADGWGVYPTLGADGSLLRIADDGDRWDHVDFIGVEVHGLHAGRDAFTVGLPGELIGTEARLIIVVPDYVELSELSERREERARSTTGFSLVFDEIADLRDKRAAARVADERLLAGQLPLDAIDRVAVSARDPRRLSVGVHEALTSPGWPRELLVAFQLHRDAPAAAELAGPLISHIARRRLQAPGVSGHDAQVLRALADGRPTDGPSVELPAAVPIVLPASGA